MRGTDDGGAPGRLELHGWRERGSSWWVTGFGASACVVVGLATAISTARRSPEDRVGFVFALVVVLAGLVGVAAVARRRLRVDADGIAVRTIQTWRLPWSAVADVLVLRPERGRPSVVVVDADGVATKLSTPADATQVVAQIADLRPLPVAAAPVDQRSDAPPRPIVVVASGWQFALLVGVSIFLAVFGAVIVTAIADSGGPVVAFSVAVVAYVAAFVGVTASAYRRHRQVVVADASSITVGRATGPATIAMSSVDRFVLVVERWPAPSRGLGAVVRGEVVEVRVPVGKAQRRVRPLVDALERLRVAGDDPRGAGADGFDPQFSPNRLPPGPLPWLVPSLLAALTVVLALVIARGAADDRASAEAMRSRSVLVSATVVSVDVSGRRTWADLRFETPSGPRTVELVLEGDEAAGTSPVALRYDPQDPTVAWRADDSPPNPLGSSALLMLTFWVPASIGVVLWLRWHPPPVVRAAAAGVA